MVSYYVVFFSQQRSFEVTFVVAFFASDIVLGILFDILLRKMCMHRRQKCWAKVGDDPKIEFAGADDKANKRVKEPKEHDAEAVVRNHTMDDAGDTTDEYVDTMIQVAYVTIFSGFAPFLPILALAQNLLEIKLNACRHVTLTQRAEAEKANHKGVVEYILEVTTFLGAIISVYMLLFLWTPLDTFSDWWNRTIDSLPGLTQQAQVNLGTNNTKLFALVILEHILVGVKLFIRAYTDEKPRWVRKRRAKASETPPLRPVPHCVTHEDPHPTMEQKTN